MSDPTARRRLAHAAAALALGAGVALAQPAPEPSVWLKNGGFVRGTLIELVPGDHVTLQLATGELRRIPAADIDRITGLDRSPAASASAAQPSPPQPSASPPPPALASSSSPAASSPAASSSPRDRVTVRLVGPRNDIELQGRMRLDRGPWSTLCAVPCGSSVPVIDREFRVGGPGVTPSHTFIVEPGERPVSLEVLPGNEQTYQWGRRAFLAGTPLLLLGGLSLGLGVGTQIDHRDTFRTVGLVTAIAGGAMLLTSLPLLYSGQTRVRNANKLEVGAAHRAPLF